MASCKPQHPLEMAYYNPAEINSDSRTHRYRSFMIEEILTDHRERKAAAPVGDFLKFGVHALLSARPLHNQLGKAGEPSTRCICRCNRVVRFMLDRARLHLLPRASLIRADKNQGISVFTGLVFKINALFSRILHILKTHGPFAF